MQHRTRRLFVAGTSVAIALGGLSAASAAPTEVQVRPSDFVAAGTAKTGDAVADFLAEGIHLKVAGSDYAIGVFPTDVALADVNSVSYEWFGTANRPGVKYNVDVDGDGKWDCQLVGEQAYGGTDVWLNKDAQDAPDSALPDDTCADAAPVTGGGSGSEFHGDLDAWAASLADVADETPVVVQAGYGASGLDQDGVLRSISLGDTTYVFTATAAAGPASDVTATEEHTVEGRNVSVTVTADAVPEGKTEGAPATVEIKQGLATGGTQTTRLTAELGASKTLTWSTTVQNDGKKRRIQVFINGEKVSGFLVP